LRYKIINTIHYTIEAIALSNLFDM